MIGRIFKGQSPKSKISLGLVSILVCICIGASLLGLFPDRYGAVLAGRVAIAELVAVNSSAFITRNDIRRMEANLQILISRNDDILSATVKPMNGKSVAVIGEHETKWEPLEEGFSTESQLIVPIWEGKKQWGHIELRFTPLKEKGWFAFFFEPLAQFILFLSFFSYFIFKYYLGKMLKQLDPSQAIPGRVRSALDTMAEGLLVLDIKQNIVLANEAFSQLVKEDPEKIMGRNIEKFNWRHADKNNGIPIVIEQKYPWKIALETSSLQMNHMLYLELDEHTRHTFMVNCSPVLGQNGKVAGMMVSFDDITELEEKEIELRRSKEEAEMANRAKSDFLSHMSHEIRTPMNAILGFTEVLMRGNKNDPVENERYLSTISSSGKHLLGLINDILDLSKVEAGRIEVENVVTPVHKIVQEVVKIMSVKAREKNIQLEFIALDSMPESVITDVAKVRQILTNLVGNSIKFTEKGSVKLISHYHVEGKKSRLTIDVVDTGIGMSRQQLDSVFQPFVQADSSITRRFGGTGLGLTISKRFAEALGGDIKVTSKSGEGSCFTLSIELQTVAGCKWLSPEQVIQETIAQDEEQKVTWTFPDAKVLVIDDGVENRDLLDVILTDAGLKVQTGVNGKEGLIKSLTKPFDLILMDIQMPVMDGYTAVGLMREKGITIPVIALTAHAMKGAESECLVAGYSGYMTKPIDIDKLLKTLADELGGKASYVDKIKQPNQADIHIEQPAIISNITKPAIHSTLAGSSDKYRDLILRFVERLQGQLNKIEQVATAEQYETLSDLAHWLKGSAGSVGFHDFTEPAEELEKQAKQKNNQAIADKVTEIKDLFSRIEKEDKNQISNKGSDEIALNTGTVETIQAKQLLNEINTQTASPIYSSLPGSTTKYRSLIERFIVRLKAQFVEIENATSAKDYEKLEDLAHWLKGSAGSVGFHDFTEPAEELEQYAKQKDDSGINVKTNDIKSLIARIEVQK
ncbi:Hpt domain-containing protein [Psychromonas sp. KJ10-10]|uniref:Hpt domain-containing protein n=1 Tax=Psychromonas sp. KJ10-10 TaxID=3391823 RepID=UPI0039B5E659